jgi:hypothetical protein
MPTQTGVLTSHPFSRTTFDPFRPQSYDFLDFGGDDGPDRALHPGVDFGPFTFCFNQTESQVIGDVTPQPTPVNNFLCPAHGLLNGAQVRFDSDGVPPFGVLLATYYFVVNITTDTFQISTTVGGAPINFSDAGSGHIVVVKRGIPVNFTGNSVWAWVKTTPEDPDANKLLDLVPTFNPAVLGTVQIFVPGTATVSLASASAFWDMIVGFPSSTRTGPLVKGQFSIAKIITHPAFV